MAIDTTIEWTESTWNPVTGCTKISEGCEHCYAERMAFRLKAMGAARYQHGFDVRCHPESLSLPLSWKTPRLIFVNSMGDLFHDKVPEEYICQVFQVMASARQHLFQLLTKRSERLRALAPTLQWPNNVWMGVTVESSRRYNRIDDLRTVPAAKRFLSCEPLLSSLPAIQLAGIDWVIAGGESGPGARPMHPDWVRSLRDETVAAGVAFYFKQWGGTQRSLAGRVLDGETWDQMPELSSPLGGRQRLLL